MRLSARPWTPVVVFFAWFLACAPVAAQLAPDHVYVASRYMPHLEYQNFGTLAEAEAYLRTEPATPIGNALLERTEVLNLGTDVVLKYSVPKRKYVRSEDYYSGHVSGNQTDCSTNGCDTEAQMVAASMKAYPLLNEYTASLQGSYISEPFAGWFGGERAATVYTNPTPQPGDSRSQRYVLVHNPRTGNTDYAFAPNRTDLYECPPLFHASDNRSNDPRIGPWPLICHNYARGEIRKIVKQYAPSCPKPAGIQSINSRVGNPCATDTGNKEYRESDFDWDGWSFSRTYNSIGDFDLQSGMSDNWAHSFSDRLTVNIWGGPVFWVRADGYVEWFAETATSGVYRPSSSNDTALRKQIDPATIAAKGVWELMLPDGSRLWFDANGRLRRSERGAQVLVFERCGGVELGADSCPDDASLARVVSASGRELRFGYIVVSLPGGSAGSRRAIRLQSISSGGTVLMHYEYDASARLVRARHGGPTGVGREYLYAEANRLCLDHLGNVVSPCNATAFPNHLTGVVDENGDRYATYSYDDKGRVTASEHAGGVGRVALHYVSASTTKVALPGGAIQTFTFSADAYKKPIKVEIAAATGESQTMLASYASDRATSTTDAGGTRTDFASDGVRESSRIEGLSPSGAATAHTRATKTDWDAQAGRPSRVRRYDATNALIAQTDINYNARAQPLTVSVVDPGNAAETRVIATTYCEQADVAIGLCPLPGLTISVDGPRTDVSDVTRYDYYPNDDIGCAVGSSCRYRKGDLWKITDALGMVTERLGYDASGRVLSSKDANGVVTDSEYHSRGWLSAQKVRGPDAAVETDDLITRIEYFPSGLVKQVTLPDGNFTRYGYDAAHRLISVEDRSGSAIRYTLDEAGQRVQEDFKKSDGVMYRTLARIYDALGQLKTYKDGLGHETQYSYDAAGRSDKITDALGRIGDDDHDPLGRLVRNLQDVGAGRINAETRFEYDALDQLVKVIDPKGLETTYTYDAFGSLVRLVSPDTGTMSYTYDRAGNRKTRTDARDVIASYSYDGLGRLAQESYPDAALGTSYAYDTVAEGCPAGETYAKGRLSQTSGTGGTVRYCYDRFGRMVRKTIQTTGPVLTLRYGYSDADALKSITYPDGTVADYVRSTHGQIIEVGVTRPGVAREILVTSVDYYPYSSPVGWTYGNGRPMTRGLDRNYNVYKLLGSPMDGLSVYLQRDAVGNVKQLSTADQSQILARYEYDALNRLAQTQDGPTGTALESYRYDATGNRLSMQNGGGLQTYVYPATSHRLQSVGGVDRTYDAAGNTLNIGSPAREFVYNDLGRMSQVKANGSTTMRYAYNGQGQQVRRYIGTQARHAFYDESGRWLGEYDDTGAALQQVVWLDGLPVGLLDDVGGGQKLHYIEPDHLGSPRVVIDPARNVAVWKWQIKGEAFGATQPGQDPDLDGVEFVFDMRYPGQRYDEASRLNYNYFRDYDPESGRYVRSDPIGLRGGISTYAYADGAPMDSVDFYGLQSKKLPGTPGSTPNPWNQYQNSRSGDGSSMEDRVRDYRQDQLNQMGNKGPGPEEGADKLTPFGEMICTLVVCYKKDAPNLCNRSDGWYREYFVPRDPTMAQVNRMRNCDCVKAKHVLSYQQPQADIEDALEILTRYLQARSSRLRGR
ncbi:RHS repeat-associated core domain-containing protein [Lysobacter sp. 1R34A]|uniref:RHS repeat-associated core domain-containing protein n=1 Tax=Lysobacter sp. 1R34A TaxID=3445786 RepID=UPI003EF0350F